MYPSKSFFLNFFHTALVYVDTKGSITTPNKLSSGPKAVFRTLVLGGPAEIARGGGPWKTGRIFLGQEVESKLEPE